jgi:hypothetical protein
MYLIQDKKYRTQFVIIGAFVIFLIIAKFSDVHLKDYGIILNGKTLKWVYGTKTRGISYEFIYKGEKITSTSLYNDIYGYDIFLNRTFPVKYDTTIGRSAILIVPSDFKDNDVPFPDSLDWVRKYLQ